MKHDDVIRPKFGSTLTVNDKPRDCEHWSVVVDSKEREVSCSSCGKILDPFSILLQYAYKDRTFGFTREGMLKSREEHNKLLEEEKRIKSRIRYAKKKGARECDVVSECPILKQFNEQNIELRRALMKERNNKK